MRRGIRILLAILTISMLCACGAGNDSPVISEQERDAHVMPVEQVTTALKETEAESKAEAASKVESETTPTAESDTTQATSEASDTKESEASMGLISNGWTDAPELKTDTAGTEFIERQLSIDEVQEFEDYLNRIDNYGFMLSMYESPVQVDLGQVLYVGAGMEVLPMSEEERQAYLNTTGMEEIYTDVTHLTTAQIEGFLQEKLGVSLEDMESTFSWTYVPEYDSYYHQAGDTNMMSWDCVSGREVAEGIYTLKLDCPYDYRYDCEVTVKKVDDAYQFISNQPREYLTIPEEGLHTELSWQQTFTEIVEGIGAGWEGFELIYLNEDEIPELVAIGASQAAGCRIYNYENGVVYETQLNRLNFTYIERENLLCNSDGNMDHYYDIVYSIIDGRMTQIAIGRFGVDDAVGMQVDEEGNLIYKYTWNEVDMSKEEYAQALNAVYDISKAREGYQWEGWYGKKEIIEELR